MKNVHNLSDLFYGYNTSLQDVIDNRERLEKSEVEFEEFKEAIKSSSELSETLKTIGITHNGAIFKLVPSHNADEENDFYLSVEEYKEPLGSYSVNNLTNDVTDVTDIDDSVPF